MKEIRLALRMTRLKRTEEQIAQVLKRTPIEVRRRLRAVALEERRRKGFVYNHRVGWF